MTPRIKNLIGLLLICLAAVCAAEAQDAAQPALSQMPAVEPAINSFFAHHSIQPPRLGRDQWIRLSLVWASTAFDLGTTRYALARNPYAREGNPLISGRNGNLQAGRYLGITLPLNALATIATLKYPQSKSVRVLTYVTSAVKIGIGVSNLNHVR